MKEQIRLFVAAPLPSLLKATLQEQLQAVEHPALRFVPEQNLHLTLHFIGTVALAQLPAIQEAIRGVAQQHQPFTLTYQATEPGPKPRPPRLVWARFVPHESFEQLSQALAQALTEAPRKTQKAIPHITLARFRKDQPPPKGLPSITSAAPLFLEVTAISLWQSTLAAPHPVYSILETYPLRNA